MIQINLSSKSIAIDGSDNYRVWVSMGTSKVHIWRYVASFSYFVFQLKRIL